MGRLDLRTRESALRGGARGVRPRPGQRRARAGCIGASRASSSRRCRRRATPLTRRASRRAEAMDRRRREMGCAGVVDERDPVRGRARRAGERSITPEERNYWAFKLPVQAPLPDVGDAGSRTRSIGSSKRRARAHAAEAGAARRPPHAGAPRLSRPDRPAADAGARSTRSSRIDRPDAWERSIDKLLASPHYGERWGRHWLDVARYADSSGFEYDYAPAQRLALSRLRDQVVQRGQAVRPVPDRADRRRRAGRQDRRQPRSPPDSCALGPRVLFREKDNPERRYDYSTR